MAVPGSTAPAKHVPTWEAKCKHVDEELQAGQCCIRTVSCSKDAILAGSARPVVKVWKLAEAKLAQQQLLKHGAVGTCSTDVAEDGNAVVVCSDDGTISLWDLRQKARTGELPSIIANGGKAKFVHAGGLPSLASSGPSGAVCLWDLRTGGLAAEAAYSSPANAGLPPKKKFRGERHAAAGGGASARGCEVYSLAIAPDHRTLACGRASGDLSIMEVDGARWVGTVRVHSGGGSGFSPVRGLAFDPAAAALCSGGDDHHICSWPLTEWMAQPGGARVPRIERLSAHRGWITSLSICQSESRSAMVTTSWDATVKLWEPLSQRLLCSYKQHDDSVLASAFAPGAGDFFVTSGADSAIAVYVAKDGGA